MMNTTRFALTAVLGLGVVAVDAADVCFRPGSSEIVIAPTACQVVQVAAEEAKTFLSQALGTDVPVVRKRTPGKTALVLGANAWADAAGVTTNGLVRDAFRIRTADGDAVYIVGIDDPKAPARAARAGQGEYANNFERATCFGVYEFLERFAGVRFYFPGELGTIVPKHACVCVPETDETIAPYATERRYQISDGGQWYEPEAAGVKVSPARLSNWWRLRMQTYYKPCCHGTTKFRYMERFAASHPEYFALLPDGRRHCSPLITFPGHPGQLCHTSGIWDEIYRDARSYLLGEDASVRGIFIDKKVVPGRKLTYGWGRNCSERRYVDVMPQDGMIKCVCPTCQAYYKTQPEVGWASALIWSNTVSVANRLKAEGIGGTITQMAYSKTRRVPDIDIPDNVDVMVAERGPFVVEDAPELKREYDEVKAWYEKLGKRKVWLWTYVHKYRRLYEPGIILMTPRAVGKYFKDLAPYVSGAFMETEIDRSFGNLINWYVFAKVMWNPKVDVEALLDEYHRLMFGAAAPEMAAFYREVEDIWIGQLAGKTVETSVGPQSTAPTQEAMYTTVYSPEVIRRWEGLFAAAEARVAADSLEGRRLALVKRETLEELKKAIAAYLAKREGFRKFTAEAGEDAAHRILVDTVVSKNRCRTKAPVRAWANVWKTATHLVVSFDCEEPEMANTVAPVRKPGDSLVWTDNAVGVVLCPLGKHTDYSQIFLSSSGSLWATYSRMKDGRRERDAAWQPDIRTSVGRTPTGWQAKIEIPLSAYPNLPDVVPMNFVRTRTLKSGSVNILWGDYPDYYTDLEKFGRIRF